MEMDWMSIITAIAGAIGGGGIAELLHWRANKRKALAGAKQAEADADNSVIDALGKVVDQIQEQDDKYINLINEKDRRFEELFVECQDIRSEATAAENFMCVHLGCGMRKPIHGQGRKWYATHREDFALGADYMPVNVLLKKYGELKKQNLDMDLTGERELEINEEETSGEE